MSHFLIVMLIEVILSVMAANEDLTFSILTHKNILCNNTQHLNKNTTLSITILNVLAMEAECCFAGYCKCRVLHFLIVMLSEVILSVVAARGFDIQHIDTQHSNVTTTLSITTFSITMLSISIKILHSAL